MSTGSTLLKVGLALVALLIVLSVVSVAVGVVVWAIETVVSLLVLAGIVVGAYLLYGYVTGSDAVRSRPRDRRYGR